MRHRVALVLALASFAVGWVIISANGQEVKPSEIPLSDPLPALSDSTALPVTSEKVGDRYSSDNRRAQARHDAASPALQSKLLREGIAINGMGDPKQLIFQGVTLFPEDELRQSFANDLKYQVAARPTNDTLHFAATLTERLTEGYWNSGCQKAVVRVGRSTSREAMIVQVDEGIRYRKGKITVDAPDSVDKQQLVKRLTTTQKPCSWHVEYDRVLPNSSDDDAVWKVGEDVDYTPKGLERLRTEVQRALIDQGLPYATFRLDRDTHTHDHIADLDIYILGNATPIVVGSIEIEGLKRDSREKLLKYLEFAEGDRFDAALVKRVEAKLKHSCRYWKIDITAKFAAAAAGAPNATSDKRAGLRLKLYEYDPMPPIDEPLAEPDEILRKAAELFADDEKTPPAEVVFSGRLKKVNDPTQEMQVVRGAFSVRHGLAFDLKLTDGLPLSIDHSLIIESHEIDVFDWRLHQKFALHLPQRLNLQIAQNQNFDDAGKYDQSLHLGCAANNYAEAKSPSGNAWEMSIEPVGLLHMAHRPGAQTCVHDGRLTLSFGNGTRSEADFDATTGRILCLRLLGGDDTNKWSANVDFEPGKFSDVTSSIRTRGREIADSYDGKHATASAVKFVLGEMEAQPSVQAHSKLRRSCEIAKFLQTLPCSQRLFERLDLLLAKANTGGENPRPASSRTFNIPDSSPTDDDSTEVFWRRVLHLAPMIADEAFPRGSWPWVTVRELACMQVLDEMDDSHERTAELVGKEFAKMASRSDSGPVGTSLFTKALQTASAGRGTTEFGAGVAAATLRDLSDDAFTRDIRLLTEGHEGLGVISREAAESFGKLSADEQHRLIAAMPACLHDPLDRLAARRKEMPSEPSAESIKAALIESWHHGLRETVAAELQRISVNGAKQWLDGTETAQRDSPTKSQ